MWRQLHLTLTFVLLCRPSDSQDYSIVRQMASDCLTDDTSEYNQYYDTSQLACASCSENRTSQTVSVDGLRCECREDYRIKSFLGNYGNLTCEKCPTGQVASQSGWECVACNTTGAPSTGQCQDCWDDDVILADRTLTGDPVTDDVNNHIAKCVTCQNGTEPDDDGTRCVRCNQELSVQTTGCVCPPDREAGGLCFGSACDLVSETTLDFDVTYDNIIVSSNYLTTHLRYSHGSCTDFSQIDPARLAYSNLTSCQHLANMCVMVLYNTPPATKDGPCSLHLKLSPDYNDYDGNCGSFLPHAEGYRTRENGITTWRASMPWLYYAHTADDAPDIVLDDVTIDQVYTRGSRLEFMAEGYSVDGKYLGRSTLQDSDVILCGAGESAIDAAFQYGTVFRKKCSVPVDKLLTLGEYSLRFHELYIRYRSNATGGVRLHAVPLVITNYTDPSGNKVNQEEDWTTWQLLRRYFVVDQVTGLPNSPDQVQQGIAVVRYLRDMEIHVRQRDNNLIYPPYVTMTYDYVTSDQLEQGDTVQVTFGIRYESDLTDTSRYLGIAIGVMSALALVVAILQTNNWNKREGKISVECVTIIRALTFVAGNLANAFFVTILGYSLWVFIVYKAPSEGFLVPDSGTEYYIKAYIGSAFVLKFIDLVQLVISQCSVDIFFVDWERELGGKGRPLPARTEADQYMTSRGETVSIWRRTLVANEWTEIQVCRQVKPFWQLMFMLIILHVAGVENLARVETANNLTYKHDQYVPPYNMVFRFALSASIYLALALLQWLFQKVIWTRCVYDPMMNFVDLCSSANISMFILSCYQYGFYIHGHSAHGSTDVNLRDMANNFRKEEANICGHRGLVPGSDDQMFEVFVPKKLREDYNRVLFSVYRQQFQQRQGQPSPSAGGSTRSLDPEIERRIEACIVINKYLQNYIDHTLPSLDYFVTDKTLWQRIIDMDPVEEFDTGYFFTDGHHRFDSVLFYGQEVLLVLYEIMFFTVMDMASGSFIVAAIVTYVMNELVAIIRKGIGKKNISHKTMVSQKFLI